MLEKLWDLLFKPSEENGKNNRQNLWMYLSILVMIGILLMLFSAKINPKNPENPGTPVVNDEESVPTVGSSIEPTDYERRLEERLKQILALIEGVGRVEVDVAIEQGTQYVYGQDTTVSNNRTEEKDNAGGNRVITDNSSSENIVIVRDKNGEERPLVRTEIAPIIKGVLVVADGANNAKTNAELARAVNTVLGVPLHKICVLPYKR